MDAKIHSNFLGFLILEIAYSLDTLKARVISLKKQKKKKKNSYLFKILSHFHLVQKEIPLVRRIQNYLFTQ